jgi:hypothetical protein
VVAAPGVLRAVQPRGYDRARQRAYEALVEALLEAGKLPGSPHEAARAGDRLAALYREALPRRRAEIDAVLDALADARLAERPRAQRLRTLRRWAVDGGERRATAARALALAGAAFGPTDRPLPVVI